MNSVDVLQLVTASSCLTLALVHLRIWFGERTTSSHLGFAIVAVGVAGFALAEAGMARAATAEQFGAMLRLVHLPIFAMVVGIILFVRDLFRTARPWLAHVAWVSNLVTLAALGTSPYGDYVSIHSLERTTFLGSDVTVVSGETSAWHWVGQAGFVVLTVFVVDAAWPLWRSGDARLRRRATLIGGSLVLFVVFAAGEAALNFAGILQRPLLSAPFFFPVLMAMGFELSDDVLRASRLTRALQESESALREVASEAQRLSGRLIHAQEEERSRIARELHDDLSQRLGVMSLQLDLLRRSTDVAARDTQVTRLASDIKGIATEIHALSHRLHPAKLDQLGLTTATRAWCRDIGVESGRLIDVRTEDVPANLAPDTALCLYRLLQETTRNVARHSGATSIEVTLAREGSDLRLVVRDNGRGFDVARAERSGGLGLVSMRERVRSLAGTLTIASSPGSGTRIEARVPIVLRDDDARGEVAVHASA
jgi:signal transduction histidine kinase